MLHKSGETFFCVSNSYVVIEQILFDLDVASILFIILDKKLLIFSIFNYKLLYDMFLYLT